ncbi:hypothetical protein AX769_16890 [Frondihabitans sp. PAMC 28766]|nr:hypothetical protein AX769_16890 [Frondihabitans sp. PAMC 28766]
MVIRVNMSTIASNLQAFDGVRSTIPSLTTRGVCVFATVGYVRRHLVSDDIFRLACYFLFFVGRQQFRRGVRTDRSPHIGTGTGLVRKTKAFVGPFGELATTNAHPHAITVVGMDDVVGDTCQGLFAPCTIPESDERPRLQSDR